MKSIYRKLMNARLMPILSGMRGKILDLASSGSPSYRNFFSSEAEVINGDVRATQVVSRIDFDARLPFDDSVFDYALCINALYIAKDPVFTLGELRRVTQAGGKVLVVTPFAFPEAREPHDYVRWTSEGVDRLCREAGFAEWELTPFGGHFTAAFYLIETLVHFRILRAIGHAAAKVLDRLVPERYRATHPCPLGYLLVARCKH